jgi:hypothetical protein
MKKLAIAAVLLSLVAAPAWALSIKDLLATIAMPLAVAAVSDVSGVQDNQLADLVTTLNQANVPPTQFVEVIRYVPVALVNTNDQPVFVDYVQDQYAQGITGDALVNAIVQQLQSQYDITPQIAYYEPPQTIVTQTVPVVPRQVILRQQPVQIQRQQTYFTPVDNNYIPPAVQTRVAEVRVHPVHPHGGPPGQLKKVYGVKTGAEIVHAAPPPQRIVVQQQPVVVERKVEREHGHGHGHQKQVIQAVPPPMISSAPPPQVIQQHGPPGGVPPGQAKKMEGKDHGHGKKD